MTTGQRRKTPDTRGRAAAARPLGRGAAAVGAALSRAWSLPPRRNYVAVQRGLRVPMSDGTELLADHYLPITSQPAATVLVRCPYGRSAPFSLLDTQLVAERGFHVLLQSCRGTFGSGGQFEPMRREVADGQDTVAWLRRQSWFNGRLATFGASYLGTVRVSLIGTAHRFGRGHRLRLQVAGGAHPRFARNPGNGQVDAPAKDFVVTRYEIGLSAQNPSALLLSSQTTGEEAAHA